jgi:hypothetical protein
MLGILNLKCKRQDLCAIHTCLKGIYILMQVVLLLCLSFMLLQYCQSHLFFDGAGERKVFSVVYQYQCVACTNIRLEDPSS